jgi:TRAP transporter TAXI family solute receptor
MVTKRVGNGRRSGERFNSVILMTVLAVLGGSGKGAAQETLEVGETGFGVKRPVLASACSNGCPWGELGDFVKEAMEPLGYEVILCRNCNRDLGPRVVSEAAYPPEISEVDIAVGTTQRVNAPVDFGITESSFLAAAIAGEGGYADQGPYDNLRLIARIEDPYYLLVAVKADSGINDLGDIAEQELPARILGGGASDRVLEHYGLTQEAIASWGGSVGNAMVVGMLEGANAEFDVIISELATPANNPESAYWAMYSQLHDLRFLDLPGELLDELVAEEPGMERVTARWGLLRGVDRAIDTVGRSGEAVFARDDTPEQAAYDVARAIDEHRGALKWFIRPYSYDSRTVWQNLDVPLHPGAERYYREQGYMAGPADEAEGDGGSADADAGVRACECGDDSGGCGVAAGRGRSSRSASYLLAAALGLLLFCRRRNRRQPTVSR